MTTETPEEEKIDNPFFSILKADQAAIETLMKCYCGTPDIFDSFITLLEREKITTSRAMIELGKYKNKSKLIRLGYMIQSYEMNKWNMFERALNSCRGCVNMRKKAIDKHGEQGCRVKSNQAFVDATKEGLPDDNPF